MDVPKNERVETDSIGNFQEVFSVKKRKKESGQGQTGFLFGLVWFDFCFVFETGFFL